MNKLFCVSCGFKILYEVAKPKFCSSCGQSIATLSTSSKKQEPEEERNLSIDLNKLKRGIIAEVSNQKTNLGQIWNSVTNSEASSSKERYQRPPSKDPEGQALLDKTIQDCSSSRMTDIDES